MSRAATGPWEVTGEVPKAIYDIPVSSPSHSVVYVTVEESNNDAVVFATAAAFTGMMVAWGCVVWGSGYYYPPYVWLRRRLPDLLPALSELRLRRVLQPVDRRIHARRGGVRSVWRRRRGAALQPAHRHLLARRGRIRPVWLARRGPGLQPAHRRLRRDATGLERLRQLGIHRRPARRRLGHHVALHQQRHRQDDADDADQRGRPGRQQSRARRQFHRGAQRRRRRLRRPRRQRLPQGRRQLAEVRQRRLEQRRAADAAAARPGQVAGADARLELGFVDRAAGDARFGGPRRGHAADTRGQPGAQRHVLTLRQLPRERRPGRRAAGDGRQT